LDRIVICVAAQSLLCGTLKVFDRPGLIVGTLPMAGELSIVRLETSSVVLFKRCRDRLVEEPPLPERQETIGHLFTDRVAKLVQRTGSVSLDS
jgi:hypothetical protein